MVKSVLTILLLAGLLSACDDGAPEQNEREHAVDSVSRPSPSATEPTGPYDLITDLANGDQKLESIDLCSLVQKSPEVVAAVVKFAGPLSDSRTDKHACVLTGIRQKKQKVLQIVVTTDPNTNLADSFGIDSRGYRYPSGPCTITATGYQTNGGYFAAASECAGGVWVAVASPAYPDADASQISVILEAAIKGL